MRRTGRKINTICTAAIAVLAALFCSTASAGTITLRLMRSDAPGELVSTAVTEIKFQEELDAEAAAAQGLEDAEALDEMAAPMLDDEKNKQRTKADFDRYVNYMRGILIDKKHPFQKTYKGSFLGRAAEIQLELSDGQHVIDPGGHTFTVKGNLVTSDDPDITCEGNTLSITAYPVSFIGVDAAVVREMPAELRRLPLRPMIYSDGELLLPLEKRLSPNATFKHLTLYMLSTGEQPYRIEPTNQHFTVSRGGVSVVDAAGRPVEDASVSVENKFTLVLPQVQIPLTIEAAAGRSVTVLMSGDSGRIQATEKTKDPIVRAFSSERGSTIKVGNRVQNREVPFYGDLYRYPLRRVVVDATAPDAEEPRMLITSWAAESTTAGKTFEMRIQYLDSLDKSTISPVELTAYCYSRGMLNSDSSVGQSAVPLRSADTDTLDVQKQFVDDEQTGRGHWIDLPVTPTDRPQVYEITVPELPDNVYQMRVVCDRRGQASPESKLGIEFPHAIVGSKEKTTLSIFLPAGRHAYRPGEPLDIHVTAKSPDRVTGGLLAIDIVSGDRRFNLVNRQVSTGATDKPFKRYTWSFELPKGVSALLRPDEYKLVATLNGAESNRYNFFLVEPRYNKDFHYYLHTWGGPTLDATSANYANTPPSLEEANDKRRDLDLNTRVAARMFDTIFAEWSVFRTFDLYGGRDDSSPVAQIEQMLRRNLSLPAHEIFYYQNHLESVVEASARYGLGHMNDLLEGFSPRSLMHSVKKDFEAKMRQYIITAQSFRRFPNITGWSIVKDDTNPIGDSEVGDKGRPVRLYWQRRNFIEKYGFEPPTEGNALAAMRRVAAGKGTDEDREICRKYELWVTNTNNLLSHYYETANEAVEPVHDDLLFANLGPGVAGGPSTGFGSYPPQCFRGHDILSVQTGTGDYGFACILDPYLRIQGFRMAPDRARTWGIIGNNGPWGIYNVKYYLGQFLASGAKSIGHYNTTKRLISRGKLQDKREFAVLDELRDLAKIVRTYGPMLDKLEFKPQIAVYMPYRQSIYDDIDPEREAGATHLVYDALHKLLVAGFEAEIVTEEMIDAGKLPNYKAVILSGLHYTTDKYMKAFEEYAANGGRLFHDQQTTLVPEGSQQLAIRFNDFEYAGHRWTFNALPDEGHAYLFNKAKAAAPMLRRVFDPIVPRYLQSDNLDILAATRQFGDARYTFVIDNLFPSWAQHSPSLYIWESHEMTLMPQRASVSLPGDSGPTYELFTQQQVGIEQNGRKIFDADFAFTPFRIFVTLPRPIAQLAITCPASVAPGSDFAVDVAALDPDGTVIDASIPLRVELIDAGGAVSKTINAAATPHWQDELAMYANAPTGQWHLRVEELVSGRTAEVPIEVRGEQPKGLDQRYVKMLPDVILLKADEVKKFLEERKADKERVLLVLNPSQKERYQAMAQKLAEGLAKTGVNIEIKYYGEPGVEEKTERVHLYHNWAEIPPDQFINKHVILMGGEGENVLLESIFEREILYRNLTANYPGSSKALVGVAHSAFAYQKDALCLASADLTGMFKAVDRVLALDGEQALPEFQLPVAKAAEPQKVAGKLEPGEEFARMDGIPCMDVAASPDGRFVAFGGSNYGENLFVYDLDGNQVLKKKVGLISCDNVVLGPNAESITVQSDGYTYLLDRSGKVHWRLRGAATADLAGGKYVFSAPSKRFLGLDMDLNLRWKFDRWPDYVDLEEILTAPDTSILGTIDGGETVVACLYGEGRDDARHLQELVYYDPVTGEVKRRVKPNFDPIKELVPATSFDSLSLVNGGKNFLVRAFIERKPPMPEWYVLLDENMQPLQYEQFTYRPYFGNSKGRPEIFVLADRRMVFYCGDTLYVSDADWTSLERLEFNDMILDVDVDSASNRAAVSSYAGELALVELGGKVLWKRDTGSGGMVRLVPNPQNVAFGSLRGDFALYTADGRQAWSHNVNSFMPPDKVEKHWAQLDEIKTYKTPEDRPWYEKLKDNIGLSENLVDVPKEGLSGVHVAEIEGEPFGTYYVEIAHQAATARAGVEVQVLEVEQVPAEQKPEAIIRRTINFTSGASRRTEHSFFRLGDRPGRVWLRISVPEDARISADFQVRKVDYPSENLIRFDELYRGEVSSKMRENPPCRLQMFMAFASGTHSTVHADPLALVNGKVLTPEPELLGGNWFGSGNFYVTDTFARMPCFVEIDLPKRQVISHIALWEDENGKKTDTFAVQAWIESRNVRKNLTAYEKRQLSRGFWHTAVKVRGNKDAFHVHKFDTPVYTKKLRVFLLTGHSSLNEIEFYGIQPKRPE